MDHRQGPEVKKDWSNMRDVSGIGRFIKPDRMEDQRGDIETEDGMYNWRGLSDFRKYIRLDRVINRRRGLQTKGNRHSSTNLAGMRRNTSRILDHQGRPDTKGNWNSLTDFGGMRKGVRMKSFERARGSRDGVQFDTARRFPALLRTILERHKLRRAVRHSLESFVARAAGDVRHRVSPG